MWQKQQDWLGRKTINNIGQEGYMHVVEPGKQARSFDTVRVKYINPASIKMIIFTKLESSTTQRQTCIVYKVDTRANGNLIQLNIFQTIFPSPQ